MTVALSIAGASFVLLVSLGRLFALEQQNGRRFLLAGVRGHLDDGLLRVTQAIHRFLVYITKYVITLSWYYSMHATLKLVLQFLAGLYYMIEKLLHHNRDNARRIRQDRKRAERSHLQVLTDHKVDTKLTELQKKKRNDKAMKGL